MEIFNSLTKTKELFKPLHHNDVKMYICGPTVYDNAHLGHARSAIAFDLLHRWLKFCGYHVTMARNITDIDDKIIAKALKNNETINSVATRYTQSYHNDMQYLNILPPHIEPKATQSLKAMCNLIQKLLDNNTAYYLNNGDIYFDVRCDSNYGRFKKQESDETQSRIEIETEKRSVRDFVLWKHAHPHEVGFDSPFGYGRPGWHLECSAMIDEHLAYHSGEYQIDIHGGGNDLSFPHHENECAQTFCAYQQHLAHYWIHNGFVTINGEKMSKSLGNSFFIKDALKIYDGEILRFYLLSSHYRSHFNFSEEDLLVSKKRLDKLYRLKKRVSGIQENTELLSKTSDTFLMQLTQALDDDLNISLALAAIDEMLSHANDNLDMYPKDNELKSRIASYLRIIESILGVGYKNPYEYFKIGLNEEEKNKIEEMIDKRTIAKKEKNYLVADNIRKELLEMGISLMDTPQGTMWEKI